MPVDAGNTLATAFNSGNQSGNITWNYNGAVGSSDLNDYYRFSLSSSSSFNIGLNGLTADADVQLLSSTGGAIASSNNSGTAAESIDRVLGAGTYYIRVYRYSGDTNYALNLQGSGTGVDAGNTRPTAYDMGSFADGSNRSQTNSVSSTDTNDYYRFYLYQNSAISLSLSELSADADVQLYNSSGTLITGSYNGSSTSESITELLNAGTYYVRVFPYANATTDYRLSVATSPDSAGNSLAQARSVALSSTTTTYSDRVDSIDTNDYYRFTLGSARTLNLALNGLSADADVQLLDSVGNLITSSTYGETTPEALQRTLNAGTYYIRVFPYNEANTNYNLELYTSEADFAGNSLGAARDITIGSNPNTYSDWVGSTDTDDYYRFTFNSAGNLNLALNGLSADADVRLLDSQGNIITSSIYSGTTAEAIAQSLAAGTYYIQVYRYGGAQTNYNLRLYLANSEAAGNSLGAARDLGALGSTTQNFSDWVGSTDTNDYYRFTLAGSSAFNLLLNGMGADADVQLLNSVGALIASSNSSGTTSDSIVRNLAAGTYYVRVYPYSTNHTNYNLSLSASPLDFAGNTRAAARVIPATATGTTYQDWVGSTDTNDFYRFTLTSAGTVNLTLSGLSQDADLYLFNSSGPNYIASSANGGTTVDSIVQTLSAGTYYIQVQPYSSAETFYNLQVFTTPADYAGNTLGAARDISVGNVTTTYRDWVGSTDTNDYYRFTLSGTSNFHLALNGLTADADVYLLDSAGNSITYSVNSGTAAEAITRTLNAGTYYLRVYPYSSANTFYNLAVSATAIAPPDYAGNTLALARAVTLSSTPTIYSDWVGSADTNDYYRFTLGAQSDLNLALNGLSADADVQLLNNAGVLIASSLGNGSSAESISRRLAAGTYYVRVYPYQTANTFYNLSLAATTVAAATADWTFLVYLDADNNLEAPGVEDFLEMSSVGSNSNVNVVVQFDRAAGYDSRYGNWTDTRRGLVGAGNVPDQNWGTSIGEANMGAQSTLTDFLNWGVSTYRASNYALVLWNHGGGWNYICSDNSSGDHLTANEVSGALASLSEPLDLVGADACLMGMTEFAHQVRNYASVFVGSEQLEPGDGWEYNNILADLRANSTMSAAQLGSVIVNRYEERYGGAGSSETLSAISLSAIAGLSTALSTFATTFMNDGTNTDRSRLAIARNGANFYSDSYRRDLGTILTSVAGDTLMTSSIRTAASSALSAYTSAIIDNFSAASQRATGLAVYFPSASVESSYSASNSTFAAETSWDEFLRWWVA